MITNKALKQRIEAILISLPHCRDDDQRLMANVWAQEIIARIGQTGYNNMKGDELLGEFAKHKLSNPESIRRMRQKIQELHPVLRGDNYKERQRHQKTVKQEVRNFNN